MANAKFLQFHTLTSYPATLLNRDDAGFAKRLPFGGTTRTRVSSQCLKYHWRNFDGEHALYQMDVPKSYRSRETFQRHLARPLIDDNYPEPLVRAATFAIKERLLSDKKASKNDLKKQINPGEGEEDEAWEALKTNQITIFGAPEMRYLRNLIEEKIDSLENELQAFWNGHKDLDSDTVDKAVEAIGDFSKGDLKKNLKGLELASGLDASMFGRMVTSDVLARGDAAIHVSHAFTTHEEESESDYFSAVDELRRDEPEDSGELGAGHINSTELSSGLFYSYVVVDVPLLISNLEGVDRNNWQEADPTLAAETIKRLTHLITTVSPGAKLGSTAPYSYAKMLLAEAGSSQPRTLANAFHQAVPKNSNGVLSNSYEALGKEVANIDAMYKQQTDRRLAAMDAGDQLLQQVGVNQVTSVPEIAEWAADQVGGA